MASPIKNKLRGDTVVAPLDSPQKLGLRMLTSKLWLITSGIAILIFIVSVGFDWLLLERSETPLAIVVSNALVAISAGALVFTMLAYGRKQRDQALHRLEALGEVNHHIRNALQSLAFAAGTLHDRHEAEAISEAISRIQWALLEVLPRVEPSYEPFEGSAREAAEQNLLPRNRPGS